MDTTNDRIALGILIGMEEALLRGDLSTVQYGLDLLISNTEDYIIGQTLPPEARHPLTMTKH
jgi:hypothetical protein